MEFRRFQPSTDYPIMQEWLRERKYPCIELKLLPPTGVVVSTGSGPICIGFLIKTDANVAVIAHLASNPNSDKLKRSEAVDALIQKLTELAKQSGYLVVNAVTNLPHLLKRYERHGWIQADENLTGVWRSLCP